MHSNNNNNSGYEDDHQLWPEFNDLEKIEPEFCEWWELQKLCENCEDAEATSANVAPLAAAAADDVALVDLTLEEEPTVDELNTVASSPAATDVAIGLEEEGSNVHAADEDPPVTVDLAEGPTVTVGASSFSKKRRKRSIMKDVDENGRPDWLPSGWTFQRKERTNQNIKTKGMVDWLFSSPGNQTYRSRKDVERFLEYQESLLKAKGEVDAGERRSKSKRCYRC